MGNRDRGERVRVAETVGAEAAIASNGGLAGSGPCLARHLWLAGGRADVRPVYQAVGVLIGALFVGLCARVSAWGGEKGAATGPKFRELFPAEQSRLARDVLTLRRIHRKLLLKQSAALIMQRPGHLGGGPSDISADLVDTTVVSMRKEPDAGDKFINQYQIIEKLGKGSFGKVKLIMHTETGETFAMKIFNKNVLKKKRMGTRNMIQDVEHEIRIMKMMDHPNCVKLYEVLNDPEHHKFFLRIELCEGGCCMPGDGPMEPLDEELARKYFRDLIVGVEYMHSKNLIHRDIKPENLLLSGSGQLKLADFGTSQYMEDGNDMINNTAGTPAFTAPEACAEGDISGKAADIWACGVTLYMFTHGRVPFLSANLVQIFQMIREDPIEFSESLSAECRDLLEKLLDKNMTTRIKLQDIKSHPWLAMAMRAGSS